MTYQEIKLEINRLARKAQPADNSAPLNPVIDLGQFVVKHVNKITRALDEARQANELRQMRQ